LRKFKVAYFGASCDEESENKKFHEKLDLDYPLLSDPQRDVAKAFGVVSGDSGYPARWTFFIDAEGKIAHIDKAVNVGSHGADCAAKLKELGVAAAGE